MKPKLKVTQVRSGIGRPSTWASVWPIACGRASRRAVASWTTPSLSSAGRWRERSFPRSTSVAPSGVTRVPAGMLEP